MRTMCSNCGKKTKTDIGQNKNRQCDRSGGKGSLKIVGIGPGGIDQISAQARKTIEDSEVIAGYKTYIKLLGSFAADKEIISSGMKEEIKRAECAIEYAKKGKTVCVISSGDAGVYGMAGLVLELLKSEDADELKVEIVPGIIAAAAAASLLGAPLMHDFAVISLSDLLTDIDLIKLRIESAAKADFVIALYNPKSAKRITPFKEACEVMLKYKSPYTPVGIVKNAYRDKQEVSITDLEHLASFEKINMVTIIIIGNSQTYVKDKFMITPRGYNLKEQNVR